MFSYIEDITYRTEYEFCFPLIYRGINLIVCVLFVQKSNRGVFVKSDENFKVGKFGFFLLKMFYVPMAIR